MSAETVFEVLDSWGVRHVFSCPGTTEVALLDAAVDHPSPELVLTTHESIAVAMADGFARASGRPGVAYLHTHLGLANGLAHLYCATLAASPVTVLTGLKPSTLAGRKGFTSIPHVADLVRPFCKSVRQAAHPALLGEDLHATITASVTPPAGPAWLGIPQDVLEAPADRHALRPTPRPRYRPDPSAVAMAAGLLAGARRPLIVAGDEVAKHDASERLEALALRLGAPVFAPPRHDLQFASLRTGHSHYCGRLDFDGDAVKRADVVLVAGQGTFQEFAPRMTPWFPDDVTVVHLSEDAAQLGRLSPATVPLAGDAGLALADLLAALADLPGPSGDAYLAECRAAHLAGAPASDPPDGGPGALGVGAAMAALARHVDGGTTVVSDCVTSQTALLDHLPRHDGRSLYSTEGGSLGWGVGAALGVRLALPGRRVLAVLGDGVFQFGLQGLWTAVRHRLPVTMIVLNNGAYQAVRAGLRRYGRRALATGVYPLTDISGPDYAAVARGFGATAFTVDSAAALDAALEESAAATGPVVVDVRLGAA
ncbi:thiamine pyrophosphate-binding protein [Spongiactinospora sp. TRM90649]|uniref:thiamine pyrophosphate-binding protein n=1 Tax=Spongiactinospora sp. TRM90649 TaxID=3031114 RepID=UPI0023F7CE8A|nr:thiamine pyrophosphate-binding protein [Spongiactinospora sp. TRM90649]MDF5756932.1 thiamine pyrophosphate-binding protein [Spongiactinospora sp. TRM90649]